MTSAEDFGGATTRPPVLFVGNLNGPKSEKMKGAYCEEFSKHITQLVVLYFLTISKFDLKKMFSQI